MRNDDYAIWSARNPKENTFYIALFNLSNEARTIETTIEEAEIQTASALLDLWSGETEAISTHHISKQLPPHSCVIYQLL